MTAILVTALAMWLVIVAAPKTPLAAALRRVLVEAPAARLARVGPGQVALLVAGALVVGTVLWVGGDGPRLLTMGAPDMMTLVSGLELSAYLDVAVIAVAAWSTLRVRDGWRAVRNVVSRRPRVRRRASPARAARRPAPANDDSEPRAGKQAA